MRSNPAQSQNSVLVSKVHLLPTESVTAKRSKYNFIMGSKREYPQFDFGFSKVMGRISSTKLPA